jgi:GNAT superfamily N-acetyltransferase
MNMEIYQASKENLPKILEIYAKVLDKGNIISIEKAEELFHKMQSYPNYKIYLAEKDGKFIGTFALLIMENLAHQGTPSGVVEDVAVLNEYQGQGIGRAMMEFAIEKCLEAGCYKMALSSNLNRIEAHTFYESLDFEKHGYSFRIEI